APRHHTCSAFQFSPYSRVARTFPSFLFNDTATTEIYTLSLHDALPIFESLTLLIPNFYGGASRDALPKNSATEQALRQNGIAPAEINSFISGAPTYWGDQPGTGGPIYGGAIMVFLFVLGIIYAPGKYRNIFLAITIVSLMLSWGKNLQWFNYTLFDYLPGYNKFRAVSMALGVTLFAIPVLGCLGLEQVIQNTQKKEAIKALL